MDPGEVNPQKRGYTDEVIDAIKTSKLSDEEDTALTTFSYALRVLGVDASVVDDYQATCYQLGRVVKLHDGSAFKEIKENIDAADLKSAITLTKALSVPGHLAKVLRDLTAVPEDPLTLKQMGVVSSLAGAVSPNLGTGLKTLFIVSKALTTVEAYRTLHAATESGDAKAVEIAEAKLLSNATKTAQLVAKQFGLEDLNLPLGVISCTFGLEAQYKTTMQNAAKAAEEAASAEAKEKGTAALWVDAMDESVRNYFTLHQEAFSTLSNGILSGKKGSDSVDGLTGVNNDRVQLLELLTDVNINRPFRPQFNAHTEGSVLLGLRADARQRLEGLKATLQAVEQPGAEIEGPDALDIAIESLSNEEGLLSLQIGNILEDAVPRLLGRSGLNETDIEFIFQVCEKLSDISKTAGVVEAAAVGRMNSLVSHTISYLYQYKVAYPDRSAEHITELAGRLEEATTETPYKAGGRNITACETWTLEAQAEWMNAVNRLMVENPILR